MEPHRQLERPREVKLRRMQEMHRKMEVPLVRPELVPKVQQGRRLRSSRLAQEAEPIVVLKIRQLKD